MAGPVGIQEAHVDWRRNELIHNIYIYIYIYIYIHMCVNDHTNSVFVPVIMLQMQAHEEEALWVVCLPTGVGWINI